MSALPFSILPFFPIITGAYLFPKLMMACAILSLVFLLWFIKGKDIKVDSLTAMLFIFLLWTTARYSGVASQLENPFLWPVLFLIGILRKDFSKPLLIITALACLYGVAQMFHWDIPIYKHCTKWVGFAPDGRPFSFFGNPNWFGEFLVGVFPLTLARWIWLSPVCVILIIATGSRAAILGTVAGLTFYLLHRQATRKYIIAAVLPFAVLAFFLTPWAWQKIADTNTPKSRLLWWTVTAQMIKAHPFLGVGAEKFREEYPEYQGRYFAERPNSSLKSAVALTWTGNAKATLESPHNEILSIGAEYGLPALFLFLGILLFIFKHAPPWAAAGAFGLSISSLFGYPFHESGNLILLGCLAASVKTAPPRLRGRPLLIFLLGLSVFLTVNYARLAWVGAHVFAATQANISQQPDRALGILGNAERFSRPDALIILQKARAYVEKGDREKAYYELQRLQKGFDPPVIYSSLAAVTGQGFYLSKRQFYYPGVK